MATMFDGGFSPETRATSPAFVCRDKDAYREAPLPKTDATSQGPGLRTIRLSLRSRIERIAHAVAEHIEREDRQEDR